MSKPLLPTANALLPYLKRIDDSRAYCNFGQLNEEYEKRLSVLFQTPVTTCSSATSGITACLLALNLPPRSFVACPSWTFVATPSAIVMAGHIPYFVDCDEKGRVTTEILRQVSNRKLIAAAVIVSPCGMPLENPKTDIPVIIDAAGGFDAFSTISLPAKYPVVISTHATKAFGTGEGGFVASHDKEFLARVRQITNFGFTPMRHAEVLGFNAKLSEYHAAVGLAELDGWEDKREMYLRKTRIYGLDYATSLVATDSGTGRKGVYGCHVHKAFKDYPRTPLPLTEKLINKTFFTQVTLCE